MMHSSFFLESMLRACRDFQTRLTSYRWGEDGCCARSGAEDGTSLWTSWAVVDGKVLSRPFCKCGSTQGLPATALSKHWTVNYRVACRSAWLTCVCGGRHTCCGFTSDTIEAGARTCALIIIVSEKMSSATALQHCHLTAPTVMMSVFPFMDKNWRDFTCKCPKEMKTCFLWFWNKESCLYFQMFCFCLFYILC